MKNIITQTELERRRILLEGVLKCLIPGVSFIVDNTNNFYYIKILNVQGLTYNPETFGRYIRVKDTTDRIEEDFIHEVLTSFFPYIEGTDYNILLR